MKMIRRDSELPIELLKPHPKNPRKDVGDVTELAESIKAIVKGMLKERYFK